MALCVVARHRDSCKTAAMACTIVLGHLRAGRLSLGASELSADVDALNGRLCHLHDLMHVKRLRVGVDRKCIAVLSLGNLLTALLEKREQDLVRHLLPADMKEHHVSMSGLSPRRHVISIQANRLSDLFQCTLLSTGVSLSKSMLVPIIKMFSR